MPKKILNIYRSGDSGYAIVEYHDHKTNTYGSESRRVYDDTKGSYIMINKRKRYLFRW